MSNSKPRRAKGAHTPIPVTRAMDIPFNQLRLSEKNVRTIYDKETIKELAESIATHGLIQSLGVRLSVSGDETATEQYEVHAGGRRFRAFELLLKQKRISADKPIPCVIKTDGIAEDDSYVENTQRESMHPIDEFRAFKRMIDAGKSETEISTTHRVSIAFVRQRLRLAVASPLLLQAYRDDEIDLEQLMAYCVIDDHARQESVFERLQGNWNNDAQDIRRALTEDTVPSTDKRVKFIGLDVYEKAGGHVERDLFSTTDQGYLKDVELLNTLVSDKLASVAEGYRAKGWKWVDAAVAIPHDAKWGLERVIGEDAPLSAKEQKRLDKLNAEIEQLDALDELTDEQDARRDELQAEVSAIEEKQPVFAEDDMARAGVFLSINHMGHLEIDAGFIKDDGAADESADNADEETANGQAASPHAGDDDENASRPLSAALMEDLTAFRTVALRNAMAQDFSIAFTSVVHAYAMSHFYTFSHGKTCLQLKMDTMFPMKAPGLAEWGPMKAVKDRDAAWRKMLPKSSADLWSALLAMEHTTLQQLFAHLASLSVNATISAHLRSADSVAHAHDLFRALDTTMVKEGWNTTAENYLSRVSKDRILEAVTEATGAETRALIAHLKKEAMAKEAERLIDGKGWLPEPLRVAAPSNATDNEDDREGADESEVLPAFLTQNAETASA
ncbi:ParB/RepB/Spo0J family partition protein [Hyphomicrobium sp.]|uniref:ParB/RepB/Spo0J family partition protein n=1 Tax=Hyphomicrobium sp. TaxID=82 RepID=UPI002E365100|nr:ParB/RepB/Spo0J family partition protein [Hyphomicrobium sp.]HEX2842071.1 ParB/RepB/Spo0J family partition protein [Hyphomicrobium sp.]